jgi:hypothetical protein
MTGGIDEVKIWNRTLSRDEIREQRHLTLSPAQVEADSDLVGYYQFNEDTYFMVNKQGSSQHGVFTGPAALASSEAVVGSGVLDRVMVDGSGSFALDAVGGAIEVAPGAAVPNGEVVVHRLDPAPPSGPEQGLPMGYWVVDTYGSGSFDAGTSWMMGASEGSLAPWMQGMADLAVVQRDPLGLEPWSVPCDMAPASDQTALYDGACGPLASAQYALVSEVCVLDTTAAGLCPEEVLVWGNSLVEGPGLYYALGAQGDDCLTLEVLDIEPLDTPPLYWNLEGEQIQAPDGWTDHVWTLNGTVLDAGGAVIPLAGSGDYTLTATDPVSGCTVAYTGTVGCPGDLDGDFIVGVSDILQLLGSFGCTDDCDNSDVNADGSVNVTDVLFLLGLFGSMC